MYLMDFVLCCTANAPAIKSSPLVLPSELFLCLQSCNSSQALPETVLALVTQSCILSYFFYLQGDFEWIPSCNSKLRADYYFIESSNLSALFRLSKCMAFRRIYLEHQEVSQLAPQQTLMRESKTPPLRCLLSPAEYMSTGLCCSSVILQSYSATKERILTRGSQRNEVKSIKSQLQYCALPGFYSYLSVRGVITSLSVHPKYSLQQVNSTSVIWIMHLSKSSRK